MNFRISRLIIFSHTRVDTFAATDAASQVEAVNELDSIHRLVIFDMRPNVVLLLHFPGDAREDLLHFLWCEFLIMVLQKTLDGGAIAQLTKWRKRGG